MANTPVTPSVRHPPLAALPSSPLAASLVRAARHTPLVRAATQAVRATPLVVRVVRDWCAMVHVVHVVHVVTSRDAVVA